MSRPLFVLESGKDLATVVRRLAGEGWLVREGFTVPEEPWDLTASRLVFTGTVDSADVVAEVVLAAARGAGVATIADPDSEAGRLLLTDLRRIGLVARIPTDQPDAAEGLHPLTEEQRALLERLADGESIAAAATAEFLSLRTANRRIAAARDALGVRTTRQAVVEFVRRRG